MSFPLSYSGRINCDPAVAAPVLLNRIAEELESAGLQNVYVWSDGVTFGGAVWQSGSPGNALTCIDEGEVKISMRDGRFVVSYSLRFRSLFFVTVACAMLGLGLFVLEGGTFGSYVIMGGLGLAAVIWNSAYATYKSASLIRRALDSV